MVITKKLNDHIMYLITTNRIKLILILLIIAIPAYFYLTPEDHATAQNAAQPQAMPVEIITVKKEAAELWFEYSGRAEAVNYAEIKPRVTGEIKQIKFKEGQKVKKGETLFVIDPRPYKAAVNVAKADLQATKTQLKLAEKDFLRADDLISTNAISEKVYDERKNAYELAKAQQAAAKARLEQAQINLDYAYVKAPFSGRTSRAEVTLGNIVEAGPNAPILTSIVSDEGMYVDFDIDEETYFSQIKPQLDKNKEIKVSVNISSYSNEPLEGKIFNLDNKIDANSGTIRARAIFKNEQFTLLPGMFISIKVAGDSDEEIILVTEKAIGTDQDRKFVWVVNEENKTEYRNIEIGKSIKGQRVILSGLSEGERIVTEGIIKIRPGAPVMDKSKIKNPEEDNSQEEV
jgi:multidrug efflux system membrane fusion protein